jgi:hypothetical protein
MATPASLWSDMVLSVANVPRRLPVLRQISSIGSSQSTRLHGGWDAIASGSMLLWTTRPFPAGRDQLSWQDKHLQSDDDKADDWGPQTHDATGREISLTISGILGSALLAKLGD